MIKNLVIILACVLHASQAFSPLLCTKPLPTTALRANKAVIWDCDGCLVDSEALLKQGEVDALVAAGFDSVTVDDCNRLFSGFAPEAGAANFLAEFGEPVPEHFFRDQIANSLQLFRDRLQPLNANTVLKLHSSGRSMVVASGSPRNRVDVCLKVAGIDHCFAGADKIFTREDVEFGKPAPDMFLLAASRLGVEASQCVVVEDSGAGITAALAANMEVVGYLGGGHAQAKWYRETIEAFGVPLVYTEDELHDFLAAR